MSRRISLLTWIASVVASWTLGFVEIGSAANNPKPTFSKEVAPILNQHCVICHRSGAIASAVPFLSYETARPWAKSIKEKVLSREMPPWSAEPSASLKFRNDPSLSQRDINTLVGWVDAGAPKGNDADLPPMPEFGEGWLHPQGLKPDLVISLPGEFQAPATGEIPYVRVLAKVPFLEDKWIAASQARPGNPALVHHMAITEVAFDRETTADNEPIALLARKLGFSAPATTAPRPAVTAPTNPAVFDMLGVYTPGTTFESYGPTGAKLLRGGENLYLNFNIHYQTTGRPEKDRSMIGFWFQPGPPKDQLFRVPASGETIIAEGRELLTDAPGKRAEGTRVAIPPIPPSEPNYEVAGVTGFTEAVTIYQFQPHAHLRGKDFKYTVVYPTGREQVVLTVPKYDFNGQLAYDLDTPLRLPAGGKLVVIAHYDNSRNNKHNPAPEKEVYFRDQNQSWDEMFTPFIQYSIDGRNPGKPAERESNELQIVEVVGCLEQSAGQLWTLTHASDTAISTTQSTNSAAIKGAEAKPLGGREYQLLGISVFNPASYKAQKVAVKGISINDAIESRVNVTSLQMVGEVCPE